MELTKLKFEGFHYDETTTSKVNSVFFIKDVYREENSFH